jgi:hypothetical protein
MLEKCKTFSALEDFRQEEARTTKLNTIKAVAEMCRTYRGDMHKQTTNYVGAINNG